MTKKDYILISTALWRAGFMQDKNRVRQQAKEERARLIAINLATDLAQDNPAFDRSKFLEACGVGK